MRYLITLILCLLAGNVQAFPPGFLATATHSYATGGGGSTFEIRAFDTGTGTTSAECSMSVNSGEKLVVSAAAETQTPGNVSVSSSPSLTWTQAVVNSTNLGGSTKIWTASASSTGTLTATVAATGSGASSCVLYAITGAETTLGGATATNGAETQGAPSVSITTTRADSLIFAVTSDWNAITGTESYRSPPTHTERLDDYTNPSQYRGYHYTAPATTTGSYTMGMEAPTGQGSNTVVLEVRKTE
jgi:hypothetical protein